VGKSYSKGEMVYLGAGGGDGQAKPRTTWGKVDSQRSLQVRQVQNKLSKPSIISGGGRGRRKKRRGRTISRVKESRGAEKTDWKEQKEREHQKTRDPR